MQCRDGNNDLRNNYRPGVENDSYIVILQFFSQGRDELFPRSIHDHMCPSSG